MIQLLPSRPSAFKSMSLVAWMRRDSFDLHFRQAKVDTSSHGLMPCLSLNNFMRMSPWQGEGLHQHPISLPSSSTTALKRSGFFLIWFSYLTKHCFNEFLSPFLKANLFPHFEPSAPGMWWDMLRPMYMWLGFEFQSSNDL